MKKEIIKKLKMPDKPGVYFFLKGKEILYIGKATSLKDRVKSYFGKDLIETRGPLLVDLIFKADKIKWQRTDSVLEALILEAALIKKHQPKYNTKEKSDKSFNYVCITKELLPKVLVIRGSNLKNLSSQKFSQVLGSPGPYPGQTIQKSLSREIFGPFPNSSQLREAMKIIRRIFPYLDDKSKNYMEFYKQINLVPDLDDKKMYLQNIKNLKLFFQGKKKDVVKNLKKEMAAFAKNKEFEKAGEIKRQLFALQHINDVALIKNNFADDRFFDPVPFFGRGTGNKAGPSDAKNLSSATLIRIEAYDIAHMSGKNMVGVMVVVLVEDGLPAQAGEVAKNEYRKFKIRTQDAANDTGALKEVLERRFTHTEWPFPELIVVDGGIAQINTAKAVLNRFGLNMSVVSVLKDEHHKPKNILGEKDIISKFKKEILLSNSEAHRFAITYHKKMRNKNFLM